MHLKEFNYELPKELIAQKPCQPRDHSRLMILNRENKSITHDYFYNLGKYLKPTDVLVANDSRVIPARIQGKKPTGGKIEILLIRPINAHQWEIMVKGKVNQDLKIIFSKNLNGILEKKLSDQTWQINFNLSGILFDKTINKLGQTPTPPYIKRSSNLKEYQTIYANSPGSSAAPTAGFHFTKKLINNLKKQKISFEFVTLHVGPGTFLPVREENIEKHKMHAEWAEISKKTADTLNKAKNNQQRIIAVGTTSARTLETFSNKNKLQAGNKMTDIFIYPGYQFKFIDGLITNFHIPESTLLMLISAFANPRFAEGSGKARATADKSAFAGRDFILTAYQEAIKNKYRFYSFGDAMLII
ncbi:MAG: tRNA preQ1(34) S-adenosylmethionine ribosyltransferase-isomerase QueA [Patescibacteria group bacterium]|nr:tRNA preQ1(34) S-adenosylmethionine ribosyltransferase-isomerase QueA [Patescibacteria group bacterium]